MTKDELIKQAANRQHAILFNGETVTLLFVKKQVDRVKVRRSNGHHAVIPITEIVYVHETVDA